MSEPDGNMQRPLPIRPRPRPGDDCATYIRRLALANHMRPAHLRHHLADPALPGQFRLDWLATLSGRTVSALRYALIDLHPDPALRRPPRRRTLPELPREELFKRIRRDAQRRGLSLNALADLHGVGERTVHQALKSARPRPRKQYPLRPSRLDPYLPVLDDLLARHLENGIAPRGIIQRLYNQLVTEHGAIDISYSMVRTYVSHYRRTAPALHTPNTLDPMIIWLNGTFGAGKTTTAKELTTLLPGSRVFDTEEVGVMLRHVLSTETVRDFQDWQPWRGLVVAAATQILDYVGGTLVVPQSVLVHHYWQEIRTGLGKADIPLQHFVLHADRHELLRRIETDAIMPNSTWRLEHLDDYDAARSWHRQEADIIDTTDLAPEQVAARIATAVTSTQTGWKP